MMDVQAIVIFVVIFVYAHTARGEICTQLGFTCQSLCLVSPKSGNKYCWLDDRNETMSLRRGVHWDYCGEPCRHHAEPILAVDGRPCILPATYNRVRYNVCMSDPVRFDNEPFCIVEQHPGSSLFNKYRRCRRYEVTTTAATILNDGAVNSNNTSAPNEELYHPNRKTLPPKPNFTSTEENDKGNVTSSTEWVAALAGAVGGAILATLLLACCMFCRKRRIGLKDQESTSTRQKYETDGTVDFNYVSGKDYVSQSITDQGNSHAFDDTLDPPEFRRNVQQAFMMVAVR